MILGGDFNSVETLLDTPGTADGLVMAGDELLAWQALVARFSLREAFQPTPTHYFIAGIPANCRASRIDRIYLSHDDTDLAIITPACFIMRTKPDIIQAFQTALSTIGPTTSTLFLPDHVPLSVAFTSTTPAPKRHSNTPRWLADHPDVLKGIHERWQRSDDARACPFEELQLWKQAARDSVKAFFRDKKRVISSYADSTAELSATLKLLRICTSTPFRPDAARAYLLRHQALNEHVTIMPSGAPLHLPDTTRLRAHFMSLIQPVETPSDVVEPELPPSSTPTSSNSFQRNLTKLKTTLPSLRQIHRRDIVEDFWGEIWSERSDAPSETPLDGYLEDHPVRVPRNLLPALPSADLVLDGVLHTNNSCPGPDGVPFAFYRSCSTVVAPLIRSIMVFIAGGGKPPSGFNHSRLYLLPKDSSLQISSTRPISVTNCENRVIAYLTVQSLTPAIQEIVSPAQRGFVPGRQGNPHILDLTQRYYSQLSRAQQHYVLFLDTKKAFDSIDHRFIIKVLIKIGMPEWVICLVQGLLHEVAAIPIPSPGGSSRVAPYPRSCSFWPTMCCCTSSQQCRASSGTPLQAHPAPDGPGLGLAEPSVKCA
jgi:hypothetical protein